MQSPGLAQTYFGTTAAWHARVVTYPALNTKHMHLHCCVNACPGADGCSRFATWSLGNAVLGSSGKGRSWTPHQLASCRQGSQHTPSQVDTDVQAACTKPAGEITACLLIYQWPAQQTSETPHPQINTYATNKLRWLLFHAAVCLHAAVLHRLKVDARPAHASRAQARSQA